MTRAVIDTDLVVSGILNRAGVPAAVLRDAGLRYELVWTPAIAVECRRILDLPPILKRLKGRETQARQVLAGGARTIGSGDAAVLAVGSFAGVLEVSAAEFLATLGDG